LRLLKDEAPLKKYLSSYWIRSAFFTFLQRFSLTLFGALNFILLVRFSLEKPQMGVWALFLLVTGLFESTKSSLLKNAQVKFVGNFPEEKAVIASSSFIINVVATFLFMLVLFFLSGPLSEWLKAGDELRKMLQWYSIGMIGFIFFSHFEAVSQSHLDFKSIFFGYFVRQGLFLAVLLSYQFLKLPISLVDLAIYQSISMALGALVMYFNSRKYLLYRFVPSMDWIKKLLGFGGYVFGIGVTSSIFTNLDQLMIARLTPAGLSTRMVATYNAATRVSGFIEVPSYAAAEILLPKVSQVNIDEGSEKVKYMYERMVAVLLCVTTPIAIFIICFPHFVINILAGAQYHDSAPILQLYMLAGLIRPIQNQAANILLYIGKARLSFLLNVLFVFVNISLNYTCFKLIDDKYGAAIGNVISCFIGTTVWYAILKKSIGVDLRNVWKYALDTYRNIFSKIALFLKLRQAHV
jgi:O-antigen/teichoic acid export membrane protein